MKTILVKIKNINVNITKITKKKKRVTCRAQWQQRHSTQPHRKQERKVPEWRGSGMHI